MNPRPLLLLASCVALAACQSAPKSAPVGAAPAAAVVVEKWVRTELFFGVAPLEAEGLGLSAAEGTWRTFLDEEVTPRFPDGFTVLDGHGQRRENAGAPIERERSKVLVILHPDTAEKRAGIEALRAAYRARTGEKGVLAVETPAAPPRF